MKYVLISCSALAACLALGWLAVGAIARHRGRTLRAPVRLLAAACLGCAALLLATTGWLAVYHHATDDALQALEDTGTVTVEPAEAGLLFDGPGTSSVMVFLPGAKVQAEAYAPLMTGVAAGGVDCLLVDPPANFALLATPTAKRWVASCPYDHVIYAGHSLGGVAASSLAAGAPAAADGLVLLSAYPTQELPDGLALLSVYGTADGLHDDEAYESSRTFWPADAQELVLEGANHANFGCYGAQRGDGAATMPARQQRDETAGAILALAGRIEEAA